MDDVLTAGTKFKWSDETLTIEEIEEKYSFPQIVKCTSDTSNAYNVPSMEPVLLAQKKHLYRLIAHTVEEGHYVMGKQISISNEYNGLFKVNNTFERDDNALKLFRSMQEVADAFPSKIYIQEPLTVTVLSNEDVSGKLLTIDLKKGDELTIISRSDLQDGVASKPVSRFISRVRVKPQQSSLVVHSTRLNESLSLPLSIQGRFATWPPLIVDVLDKRAVISLQQIMEKVNLPLTVTVAANPTRSVQDEFVLRIGMNLKLVSLEEHNVVLGILPHHRITEFASAGTTFTLPCALNDPQLSEKARNQYLACVNSALMTTKFQNDSANIEDYCKSVRFHISPHMRPTNPILLNPNACLRSINVFSPMLPRKSNQPVQTGVSAIHLLAGQSQSDESASRRFSRVKSSRTTHSLRRSLPIPDIPSISNFFAPAPPPPRHSPPLPPRNSVLNSSLPALPISSSSYSFDTESAPPIPPKSGRGGAAFTPVKMADESGVLTRPLPVPNSYENFSFMNQDFTPDARPTPPCDEEEDIWAEFQPKTDPQASMQSSSNSTEKQDNQSASISENIGVEPQPPSIPPSLPEEASSLRPDSPCFDKDFLRQDLQHVADGTVTEETSMVYENTLPSGKISDNSTAQEVADADGNKELSLDNEGRDESETTEKVVTETEVRVDTEANQRSTTDTINHLQVNGLTDNMKASSCASDESLDVSIFNAGVHGKRYVTPPLGWTPPDAIDTYTVEDVANSLRYIGLSNDVATAFYNERIDGVLLFELTDDILECDFGLSKLYRLKISRFLEGWRPKLWKSSPVYI